MVRLTVLLMLLPLMVFAGADTTRPDSLYLYGGTYLRMESLNGIVYIPKGRMEKVLDLTREWRLKYTHSENLVKSLRMQLTTDSLMLDAQQAHIYELTTTIETYHTSSDMLVSSMGASTDQLEKQLKRERTSRVLKTVGWVFLGVLTGLAGGLIMGSVWL